MSLYLKRLVSGKKARYRDDQLGLELDLAYVTDQIIVMGFPAVGVESMYRNHRTDVQRFLSAHHGSDFWIFNFCPARENAYDESVFQGRVSRYPFPDHHVPPFVYLQLVTREIHAWLSASDARVAVLHCKAGKGRSGTLACAYLLSRYASYSTSMPGPLRDIDSFSDWSLIGEREGVETPSPEMSRLPAETVRSTPVRPASVAFGADLSRFSSEPVPDALERILDLHTSRRMKPSLRPSRYSDARKKPTGVSIPSQQRWLFYWSQVLSGKGPPLLRPFLSDQNRQSLPVKMPHITKVKLTKLTIRIREPSRIQPHLVQAASVVLTSAGKGRALSESTAGKLWACLARYSDHLIDELDHWENESRSPGCGIQSSPFKSYQWDKEKMLHSFAKMGVSDVKLSEQGENTSPALAYVLRPLNATKGNGVEVRESPSEPSHESPQQCPSESSSYAVVSLSTEEHDAEDSSGVLLDAHRELRIKLFMGEVALGWAWLIPAFHMSPDSPSSNLILSSDDFDFTIGIGKALVDMKVSFACHDR